MKGFGSPQTPQGAMPPGNPGAASPPQPNFHDMLWNPGAQGASPLAAALGRPGMGQGQPQPGAGNAPGGVPLASLFNIAFGK